MDFQASWKRLVHELHRKDNWTIKELEEILSLCLQDPYFDEEEA
jgi:hypothetical protein